jgi:hypothetical protein
MHADEHGCLTEKVLGAVFEVSNTLGTGFLEKVYERALLIELRARGIRATPQASRTIWRSASIILRASLLVNFQRPKVEWKRIILSDPRPSAFICG